VAARFSGVAAAVRWLLAKIRTGAGRISRPAIRT
jgi:hypothetical protein